MRQLLFTGATLTALLGAGTAQAVPITYQFEDKVVCEEGCETIGVSGRIKVDQIGQIFPDPDGNMVSTIIGYTLTITAFDTPTGDRTVVLTPSNSDLIFEGRIVASSFSTQMTVFADDQGQIGFLDSRFGVEGSNDSGSGYFFDAGWVLAGGRTPANEVTILAFVDGFNVGGSRRIIGGADANMTAFLSPIPAAAPLLAAAVGGLALARLRRVPAHPPAPAAA